MKPVFTSHKQGGIALVVALLFLLVVTVISVVAASNSALGLRMSANLQDKYASFQAAEAGTLAAYSLWGTESDPFDGLDSADIFDNTSTLKYWGCEDPNNPLSAFKDDACAIETDVTIETESTVCPRSVAGSSIGLFQCDYYRVNSRHEMPKRARSSVEMGVVKTVIGTGAQ